MRKLGQHFLKNPSSLRMIARAVSARRRETIIEIGGGHGELTRVLVRAFPNNRIIVIERDPALAALLIKNFEDNRRIEIVEGDVRTVLPNLCSTLHTPRFTVVGNIPYYLTGKLLRILGELPRKPRRIVLTVQKEVAKRITARPPRMNRLAAFIQRWAHPEILFPILRREFRPAPEVDSAVIALETRPERATQYEDSAVIVRAVFAQPRKTILNSLVNGTGFPREKILRALREAGVDPKARPGEISPECIESFVQALREVLG